MKISENGLKRIIAFEGIKLNAYQCPVGIWTIGVGHTGYVDGAPVSRGMKITKSKAIELLREDVQCFELYLNRQPFAARLTEGMFDALVSFVFNVGEGAFETSTMRKLLCIGSAPKDVAKEFLKWVYGTVNGKKERLPGLVKRREAERRMFLSGV